MAGICSVAGWLPEDVTAPRMIRRHRAGCLRCQAEMVRMRGLLRDLAALRDEVLEAPPGLHAAVMADLGPQAGAARGSRVRTAAKAVAGTAVAAAAIAGGLVLRRQRAAG